MREAVAIGQGGKYVMDGTWVFELRDTYGLPLDIIYQELKEKNRVVDWQGYVTAAIKAGWSLKKIRSDLGEVLPPECEDRIRILITKSWEKTKDLI